MLENTYVVFVGFWDLNSITKKTNQNNWADHHMVSWIPNSEFRIPNYRVSEGKVVFLIGLWQKEIYKLDYIWR